MTVGRPRALRLRGWAGVEGWTPTTPIDAIQGPVEVFVGGHPIVIVRLAEEVFAIDGRCPHRGGPLVEGVLQGTVLRCPWHGFKYDVRTGAPAWPDGWDPAPVYAVRVNGGMVEVLVEKEPG